MRTNAVRVTIRAGATRRFVSFCLLGSFLCSIFTGCSRKFWREQAEKDTYNAIAERMTDERWNLPRVNTTPDMRSRFYDPNDPDCGPLPPDDPTAHAYMHCVNGKRGYKSWHKLGTSLSIENPHWLEPFGIQMSESGDPVAIHNQVKLEKLNLQDALELSYIHSREYQTEIENQYLAALSLTLERFQYDVRYLGAGRGQSGQAGASLFTTRDRLGSNSNIGIRQLLPSGAQWAIELTNNSLWVLGSGGGRAASSTLGYSLVQPLLAGAGRKIVLENLTLAERDVLYSTRRLARFRKTFFALTTNDYLGILQQRQIILNQISNIERVLEQLETQTSIDNRVSKTLTENFNILMPDDFQPEIPEILLGRVIVTRRAVRWRRPKDEKGMSDENAQAFIGMSNHPEWIRAATELVGRTRTEPISLSVLQLRTQLNTSLNRLQDAKRQVQDQLDAFKIQLGLPPDIEMTIDDSLLNRFQLISPEIIEVESRFKDLADEFLDLDADNVDFARLKEFLVEIDKQRDKVAGGILQSIRDGFDTLQQLIDASEKQLKAEDGKRSFATAEERERVAGDLKRDRRLLSVAEVDFAEKSERLKQVMDLVNYDSPEEAMLAVGGSAEEFGLDALPEIWRPNQIDTDDNEKVSKAEFLAALLTETRDLRERILRRTQSLQVYQIGPNVDIVASNRFHLPGETEVPTIEEAVRIGLETRLDLMNARAEVTDARRAVEIAANDLEAVLDLRVEGNLGTGRNTSNHDIGLEFTAPIDRIDQRNTYNEATILYQRARRAYMEREDEVKQDIRIRWRQLQALRAQLEIDRQTIRNAALEYDSVIQQQQAPPSQQGGSQSSLNLLRALDSVLTAQNSFVRNWFNYENNRINIFRDMGIMDIDQRGVWEDNFYQQSDRVSPNPLNTLPANDTPPLPPLENRIPAALQPDNQPADAANIVQPLDNVLSPQKITRNNFQGSNRNLKQDDSSDVYPITRTNNQPTWNVDYLDDPRVNHRVGSSGGVRTVAAGEGDDSHVRRAEARLLKVHH